MADGDSNEFLEAMGNIAKVKDMAQIAKDRDLQVRVVYAPFYKKVILFDGKQALWIKNAFTDNEKKIVLQKN